MIKGAIYLAPVAVREGAGGCSLKDRRNQGAWFLRSKNTTGVLNSRSPTSFLKRYPCFICLWCFCLLCLKAIKAGVNGLFCQQIPGKNEERGKREFLSRLISTSSDSKGPTEIAVLISIFHTFRKTADALGKYIESKRESLTSTC